MHKFPIETNMRFSLRNGDEKESFLIDSDDRPGFRKLLEAR